MTVIANPGSLQFQLSDLLIRLEDESSGPDLAFTLAAWRELQPRITNRITPARAQLARHDVLLERVRGGEVAVVPLLLFLAFVDPNFFYLARRMAARTLARGGPLSPFVRLCSARLMDSDPPKVREKVGRDVPLIIGIRLAILAGRSAERNHASLTNDGGHRVEHEWSGCEWAVARFQELGAVVPHGTIAKRWAGREKTLLSAGFDASDVSAFLGQSFRSFREGL